MSTETPQDKPANPIYTTVFEAQAPPVAAAEPPSPVVVTDTAEARATVSDTTDAAAVNETLVNTTDVDTHKTAAAPKPILKEARIGVAENKTQSQINKWIKGDPVKKPFHMELPAEASKQVAEQPADPPAVPVEPKAATTPSKLGPGELPAILPAISLSQQDSTGPRKRRMASKTVLKSSPEPQEPATKKPKPATQPAVKAVTPPKTKAPAKPRTAVARTATKRTSGVAPEVWSGVPDEKLGEGFEWSDGWTKKTFERQSGKSKGDLDSYWYTPVLQKKLRSMAEVRRFMTALKDNNGDEEAAWKAFKK